MSYIFEALKKLEQKRQRQQVSRLLINTGEPTPEPKRWPIWLFSILALLLFLNAGIMLWWVRQPIPAPANPPVTSGPSAIASAQAPVQEQPAVIKEPSQPIPARSRTAKLADRQKEAAVSPSEPVPSSTLPREKPESKKIIPPKDGKILELKELPATLKSNLPDFKISAHYYTAEPQARFTRINEMSLREGQTLTKGIKLEQITPEGVVFSYEGYRFKVGIK